MVVAGVFEYSVDALATVIRVALFKWMLSVGENRRVSRKGNRYSNYQQSSCKLSCRLAQHLRSQFLHISLSVCLCFDDRMQVEVMMPVERGAAQIARRLGSCRSTLWCDHWCNGGWSGCRAAAEPAAAMIGRSGLGFPS